MENCLKGLRKRWKGCHSLLLLARICILVSFRFYTPFESCITWSISAVGGVFDFRSCSFAQANDSAAQSNSIALVTANMLRIHGACQNSDEAGFLRSDK